ncbi:MAG: hypothetical protein ACUVTX_10990 [Bacteroidales bacterium]
MRKCLLAVSLTLLTYSVFSQVEPLWIQDTSFVRELYIMRNKFRSLSFTGYLQIQYQHAGSEGIECYNGGDFVRSSDSRFMIRRGRFRLDYEDKTKEGYYRYYFALQYDGTEKGVNIRDMFGRIYENKWNNFVLTAGVFNRPFGHELNYSSSLRESPERGRMSQILMKTERDLGVMLSFEPQDQTRNIYPLKLDAGIFNGQGLTGPCEYDSYKDFIARVSLRRFRIGNRIYLSGGLSYLNGGFSNGSDIFFRGTCSLNGSYVFVQDSSNQNIGKKAPRIYYGADLQVVFDNPFARTEFRGELITGTQSGTFKTSVTPGTPPLNSFLQPEPVYIRNFSGGYFYLIQNILEKHQVLFKYDWYDPNNKANSSELNSSGNFGPADVRFDTWGTGYIYYMNDNLKLVIYYEHPVNEKTGISGYSEDLRDDTFTIRLQFRF